MRYIDDALSELAPADGAAPQVAVESMTRASLQGLRDVVASELRRLGAPVT